MLSFPSQKILKYLILLILVLIIISIGSFFFSGPTFRERDVELTIDGLSQASVGDQVTYTVHYRNNTKVELTDINLLFVYPDGSIVLKDGVTTTELTEPIEVKDLSPGESGQREFKAYLGGDRGNIKSAKLSMSFKAGTLRSTFEKDTSFSTTIISVPITLTLVAPPNIISGQPVSYLLDYRNDSGQDLSNLRMEFTFPEGFTVQKSAPIPSGGTNVWDIPLIKQGAGSRITVDGILSGTEREVKPIAVSLKRNINGQYIDYVRATSSTTIANPLVSLDLSVNNTTNYSAYLGDELTYVARYRNTSNTNLIGLTLTVQLEGDMYEFSSINTRNSLFDASTRTVYWNAGVHEDFDNLRPGARGEQMFTIKLKPQFPGGSAGSSRDVFVKATARLEAPNVPAGTLGTNISAVSTVATKISSQPMLNQFAFYEDPNFGSLGPLPPKAGQETAFTIHWQLSNPGNNISGAKLVGVLPAGVSWTGVTSVGVGQPQISFNPNTSQVTWDIGSLPYGIGAGMPRYEASFQVKIRPSTTESDEAVKLLRQVRLTGKDSFTNQEVVVTGPELDTNNLVDRPNEGLVTE